MTLVLSISFMKQRLINMHNIITDINMSTLVPDVVKFYVSSEAHYLDSGIKKEEMPFICDPKIEVKWVENIGALRKIVPVLEEYWDRPDTLIMLTDDDRLIFPWTIQYMVWAAEMFPDSAVVAKGFNIPHKEYITKEDRIHLYNRMITTPTRVDVASSGYFLTVKPRFFDETILNWRDYEKKYHLLYGDETFISYCLAKKKIKRILIPHQRDLWKDYTWAGSGLCTDDKNREAKEIQMTLLQDVLKSV